MRILGVVFLIVGGYSCLASQLGGPARPTSEEMDRIVLSLTPNERRSFCATYRELKDPGFYRYLLGTGLSENQAYAVAYTAQFRC
jgi:hypothetical protein